MTYQVCQDFMCSKWVVNFSGGATGHYSMHEVEDVRNYCGNEAETIEAAYASFTRLVAGLTENYTCANAAPAGSVVLHEIEDGFSAFLNDVWNVLLNGAALMAESAPFI